MNLFLALEALLLVYHTANDLQLWPYYEDYLVAGRQLGGPLVQRQRLSHALGSIAENKGHLLQQLLVDVDGFFAFDLVRISPLSLPCRSTCGIARCSGFAGGRSLWCPGWRLSP